MVPMQCSITLNVITPSDISSNYKIPVNASHQVPDEFVVQRNTNANPPTLLLTLHSMLGDMTANGGTPPPAWFRDYLLRMWARLEKWYDWFNTTQMGQVG